MSKMNFALVLFSALSAVARADCVSDTTDFIDWNNDGSISSSEELNFAVDFCSKGGNPYCLDRAYESISDHTPFDEQNGKTMITQSLKVCE